MFSTIYPNVDQALVKRLHEAEHEPEFTRRDDPEYVSFLMQMEATSNGNRTAPAESLLFGLWFFAPTFRRHWSEATKDTFRHLAWVCFMHRLDKTQTAWVLLAWMNHHGRYPSPAQMAGDVLIKPLEKVWQDVQPELKKLREQRNAKRREKYDEMKKKKNQNKKGRPISTAPDSLRMRILEALKERLTVGMLIDRLGVIRPTIASQLKRLVSEGVVIRLAHGIYERTSIPRQQI